MNCAESKLWAGFREADLSGTGKLVVTHFFTKLEYS